jgi:NADH-quinone oxidoreductase subunit F
VNKPGCYEAGLGLTVTELIENYGGGIWKNRKAKACIPGGISMGLLKAEEFHCPLDFAGPGKFGCLGLGTAAVVVMDETVSMVDFLHNSARFFAHESCGQCTPCREGTSWALKMLTRIKAGKGRIKDLDLLLEIGDNIGIIPGTTICGLADGAAWPLKNAIRKFRGEFEEYIQRTNPQGYLETNPVPALELIGVH